MPRSPRVILPGVPLHLVHRGHNRAATFRCDDDFRRYLDTLRDASQRFGCAIHAYALMTNHGHLLATPEDSSAPARVMQAIGREYVRYFNARYNRTGALWESRFRSSVVASDRYLITCLRYIELNPVRAAMASHPDQYRWSSYCRNAYGDPDTLITPHRLYQALGSSPAERQAAYRALFEDSIEQHTIDRIRRAVTRGTALDDESGSIKGSEQLF